MEVILAYAYYLLKATIKKIRFDGVWKVYLILVKAKLFPDVLTFFFICIFSYEDCYQDEQI